MIIEIKYTVNVVHLDHPETITLPQSVGKLSFMKLVPGAKKVGDCWIKGMGEPEKMSWASGALSHHVCTDTILPRA